MFTSSWLIILVFSSCALSQDVLDARWIEENYEKEEHRVPMRDGVRLMTSIYRPRVQTEDLPVLMNRTPYGVGPYGAGAYRGVLGPSTELARSGFIFVYQDVRGRFQSEGTWLAMTPHRQDKASPKDVDESTDTFDTITWFSQNLKRWNGKVGMWGISYPGFYCLAGMIDAHPALVAVSPQAPATDMWRGDDFHHNGAFFLTHAFRWLTNNARVRDGLYSERLNPIQYPTEDGYRYFLELGNAGQADDWLPNGTVPAWDDMVEHPHYDDFWTRQNIIPHLKSIRPAVLNVGGWYDSEDLYGPLKAYAQIERSSGSKQNVLVMGPWIHGGWAKSDGDSLGGMSFGSSTSVFFRSEVENRFFISWLKDGSAPQLPEARVFETGSNRWRAFEAWPPTESEEVSFFTASNGRLLESPEAQQRTDFDEFLSDPNRPVPFTAEVRSTMGHEFMIEDQRFAWSRPDVLSFESQPLTEAMTLVGPLMAEIWASTNSTDADFVVKVIDVWPLDAKAPAQNPKGLIFGGLQVLVRAEVMRTRYRNDPSNPVPMVPNQPTHVRFELQDVCHTFLPGHRIMVQIQSTWFPLVDRHPQTFVDIFRAKPGDYVKAIHRIHRSPDHPTRIRGRRLKKA